MVTHQGCPQTPGGRIRALGFARMGARGRRRGPRTGDVSVSGLAGIRRRAGASAPPRVHTLGLRVHEDAGAPSRPEDRHCIIVMARGYLASGVRGPVSQQEHVDSLLDDGI
jgi:hypothetical protein